MAVATNRAAGAVSVIDTDGTHADKYLAPGDVIRAHDEAIIGTIKSVDSNTQITLTSNNTEAIDDGDLIYNISPITLILSFEK